MPILKGTFDHAIFSSEETGFTVAKLIPIESEEKVTIVGPLHEVDAGESLTCEGDWKNHPSHGKQFVVTGYKIDHPHNEVGIRRYLESGSIKGIGKKYAERIVAAFGMETLKIIDTHPERLKEVEGIGQKRIQKIKNCRISISRRLSLFPFLGISKI